jgi:hypothetical protein
MLAAVGFPRNWGGSVQARVGQTMPEVTLKKPGLWSTLWTAFSINSWSYVQEVLNLSSKVVEGLKQFPYEMSVDPGESCMLAS